jgi:hypothetical protein
MTLVSRLLSGLFVFTALLLVFASFSADKLLEVCIPTDQYGNRLSLLDLQRESEELSREFALFSQRFRAKERVMETLITGDMTLREAATEFRNFYEAPPAWNNPFRPRPEYDDGVGWCREVIDWTMNHLHGQRSPYQSEVVRQCLEAELQEQLDNYGTVTLPD